MINKMMERQIGLEKRFAVKKLIDTPAVKSKLSPIRLPHAVTDYDKIRKGKPFSHTLNTKVVIARPE